MDVAAVNLTSPYPIDPMPGWVVDLRASAAPVWVFAYGSLMWNPEMRFAERLPARIHGYHRSFCLYSPEYRGTREKPGLVLGLDRGGSCRGIAYRLAEATLATEIDLIWSALINIEVSVFQGIPKGIEVLENTGIAASAVHFLVFLRCVHPARHPARLICFASAWRRSSTSATR
jgi:cation transport regulator ChaC